MRDQGAARIGPNRQQTDSPFGEFEHLKCLWNLDDLGEIVGDRAFGADGNTNAEALFAERLGMTTPLR